MQTRQLGQSNIEISAIGLGAMGMDHAYGDQADREEMKSLLKEAVELGCNFFDTAPIYGEENEKLLGNAFKGMRESVVIATKFGIVGQEIVNDQPKNIVDSRPESIRQQVEESLNRLQTDYIDLYFQHRVDPEIEPEEVAKTMQSLIDEGKIKSWGVSEAPLDYIKRAHSVCPISAVENQYSMVYRQPEKELFDFCEQNEVTLVAYSPLGNGFLSGKYSSNETFAENDFRSTMKRFDPKVMEQNQGVLDEIELIANEKGATPAQIVLSWEINQKPFIVPIPGTTKLHRLKENLASAEVELSEADMKRINKKIDELDIDESHF